MTVPATGLGLLVLTLTFLRRIGLNTAGAFLSFPLLLSARRLLLFLLAERARRLGEEIAIVLLLLIFLLLSDFFFDLLRQDVFFFSGNLGIIEPCSKRVKFIGELPKFRFERHLSRQLPQALGPGPGIAPGQT